MRGAGPWQSSALGKALQYTFDRAGIIANVRKIQRQPVTIELGAAGQLPDFPPFKDVAPMLRIEIFFIGLACIVMGVEIANIM